MHIPVLLTQVVQNLNLKKGDTVVDCTTNRGGHSIELAKKIGKEGILICLDLDSQALDEARAFIENSISFEERPKIFYEEENFRNIIKVLKKRQIKEIDGLVADLGVSSQEIDESGRGFTFQKDEPLLMTLKDKVDLSDLTAKKIVNTWEEKNLADIILYYGDERYARRIAKKICEERKVRQIETTFDLLKIISDSVPEKYKNKKSHFATKTFQALRISVNDELCAEEALIKSLPEILKKNKRASFLTFHSGEDRMLKKTAKKFQEDLKLVKFEDRKDFIEPSLEEIRRNPRSRSAKLRVLERK